MTQEERQAKLIETAQKIGFKGDKEDQGIFGPDSFVAGVQLKNVLEELTVNEDVFNSFMEMNEPQQFSVIATGIRTAQQSLVTKWNEYIRVAMEYRIEAIKEDQRQTAISGISKQASSKLPDGTGK